jgi:hypothetical protein
VSRVCVDCPSPISRRNASGRCRPCCARYNNANPEIVARRNAAIRERFADPAVRHAVAEGIRARNRNLPAAEMERRREHGRYLAANVLNRPEVRAANAAPDVRKRAGQARTATVLPWCPKDKLDAYRRLQRIGIRAAEAKRMILEEVRADARRQIEAVTQRMRAKADRERREAY